ncbi:hypothetical protein [Streptomyces sp. HB132]|uniref:LexA family protein n=1 Tax=Streptomyces sp. HB132 TaxID=767388 RepID=UPI001EF8BDCF|nr:hypothetical protein [Streptomyces sp. HB132]
MSRPGALFDRQAAILRVIQDWITEHGEAPTVREIGARVGLAPPDRSPTSWAGSKPGALSAGPEAGGAPAACAREVSFLRRGSGTRPGAQSEQCSRGALRRAPGGCAICVVQAGGQVRGCGRSRRVIAGVSRRGCCCWRRRTGSPTCWAVHSAWWSQSPPAASASTRPAPTVKATRLPCSALAWHQCR